MPPASSDRKDEVVVGFTILNGEERGAEPVAEHVSAGKCRDITGCCDTRCNCFIAG
jgi:hypothetical protein